MDIKILSKLLGHADVNITYNVYVNLYGDGFEEMYDALCKQTKNADSCESAFLAGAVGFEPTTKVLETHVLPLHHAPKHSNGLYTKSYRLSIV